MRGILFDLFNTLVEGRDPEGKIIKEFKVSLPWVAVARFTCAQRFSTWEKYLGNILAGIGVSDNPANRKRLMRIFEEDSENIREFPDAFPTLHALKQMGYKLGLISNIPNPLYDVLRGSRLKPLFDAIIYSYKIGEIKPSATIFEAALNGLKLLPSEIIMVGDSIENDIQGARNLGIKGILLDRDGLYPHFSPRIKWLGELLKEKHLLRRGKSS